MYNRMNLSDFDSLKLLQSIERKYGHTVARFKLHPVTGGLIVETINDQHKGYRYTVNHNKVIRKKINYD